jgi:Flp pilus assembly protein TadD
MTGGVDEAQMLIELERPEQAREVLHALLHSDPDNPMALCLLAQACLGVGDTEGALHAAGAAVRVAPGEEWALRLCALALARRHRSDEARFYADSAVRTDPMNWRTHVVRAQVDLAANAVTPITIAAAQEAVRLGPHEPQTHRALGNAYLAAKQRTQAEAQLREALRLAPDDAAIRNDLARVHVQRRRLGQAAIGFADAARLDPTDQVAARNLTVVAAKALRVVHLILWAVLFTAGGAASNSRSRTVAAVGWAVAAAALLVFGYVLRRGGGAQTLHLLRVVLRRDRLLLLWFGCLVASFVLLGVAVIAPRSWISPAVTTSFVALGAGVVVNLIRSRQRR